MRTLPHGVRNPFFNSMKQSAWKLLIVLPLIPNIEIRSVLPDMKNADITLPLLHYAFILST